MWREGDGTHGATGYALPFNLTHEENLKTFAAHVFNALVVVVILFQIALAFGVSWGELTWGGKFLGVLPAYMRGVCLLSALLLIAFALVVSVRAGLLLPSWQQTSKKLIGFVSAYGALGVIANAFTSSYWERVIWLRVALALFTCSLIVAKN